MNASKNAFALASPAAKIQKTISPISQYQESQL
jgi:hypothetical protein